MTSTNIFDIDPDIKDELKQRIWQILQPPMLTEDAPIRGDGRDRLSDEMPFPECQYVANGLPLEQAQKLGNTYRAGQKIEPIDNPVADRISNKLNQIQSETQRYPLQK